LNLTILVSRACTHLLGAEHARSQEYLPNGLMGWLWLFSVSNMTYSRRDSGFGYEGRCLPTSSAPRRRWPPQAQGVPASAEHPQVRSHHHPRPAYPRSRPQHPPHRRPTRRLGWKPLTRLQHLTERGVHSAGAVTLLSNAAVRRHDGYCCKRHAHDRIWWNMAIYAFTGLSAGDVRGMPSHTGLQKRATIYLLINSQ